MVGLIVLPPETSFEEKKNGGKGEPLALATDRSQLPDVLSELGFSEQGEGLERAASDWSQGKILKSARKRNERAHQVASVEVEIDQPERQIVRRPEVHVVDDVAVLLHLPGGLKAEALSMLSGQLRPRIWSCGQADVRRGTGECLSRDGGGATFEMTRGLRSRLAIPFAAAILKASPTLANAELLPIQTREGLEAEGRLEGESGLSLVPDSWTCGRNSSISCELAPALSTSVTSRAAELWSSRIGGRDDWPSSALVVGLGRFLRLFDLET